MLAAAVKSAHPLWGAPGGGEGPRGAGRELRKPKAGGSSTPPRGSAISQPSRAASLRRRRRCGRKKGMGLRPCASRASPHGGGGVLRQGRRTHPTDKRLLPAAQAGRSRPGLGRWERAPRLSCVRQAGQGGTIASPGQRETLWKGWIWLMPPERGGLPYPEPPRAVGLGIRPSIPPPDGSWRPG